ncbi:MAG: hypothetical protein JXR46_07590 [Calditrichaceae bacterium]|nr:hypothetical protein [Calditrichaceae bacterium]MBN2708891.1 hypothetical protein [Calditrichaceae bacterium]RQV97584.1 MAG: hypothetical protein EH224_00765 [Calditrichota bacterium]
MKSRLYFTCMVLLALTGVLIAGDKINDKANSNLRLGIQNNFIIDRTDFNSGYTGPGVSAEYFFNNRLSTAGFINLLNIRTSYSGYIKLNENKLKTAEAGLLLRIRFYKSDFVVFPQVGIGLWGREAGNYTIGFGLELPSVKSIYPNIMCDYLILFGNSDNNQAEKNWTSSMIRIGINLAYAIL